MKKKILKQPKTKSKSISRKFFKKEKKQEKHLQFPNISRIFTEKFFLGALVSLVLIVTFVFISLKLYKDIKAQQEVKKERKEIIYKIQYWKGIADKYKDYRDAYFQLAILEYRLGNFDKAKFYLDKALAIDPNFEKGRELEKILIGSN